MYHITALVFSGRKNPSWEVKSEALKAAFTVFENAETDPDDSPAPIMLGYNGLQIEQGNKLWHVCRGRIFFKMNDKTVLVKKDKGQQFENLLLETAPQDVALFLRAVME
jgi:hypothetical protein